MEQRPLLEPQWRRVLYILFPFLFLAVMDTFLLWMAIEFTIELIRGEIDWLSFLCILGTFPFTALFIALAFWMLRDCFTSVYFSDEGIEQLVFGKLRCFIPWDELAEVGIGIYSWRGGPSFCLYFADRPLEDTERVELPISFRDEKNTRLIQPGDIDLKKLEELKTFCPLTFPPIPSRKEKRCTLVSYRRSRLPDGTWSDPHFYGIPDARQTLLRYREECRKGR